MNKENKILQEVNRNDGMTVPDGYFADFAARMAASLEHIPFEDQANPEYKPEAPRSFWQRVRPYVYMAAMFAGVWCMLKMFTLMSTPAASPWESNATLSEALANEAFVNDYILSDVNTYDFINQMYEDDFDFDYYDEDIPDVEPVDLDVIKADS